MPRESGREFAEKFDQWLASNLLLGEGLKDEFSAKVSLLERLIELARFYRDNHDNRFSLRELRNLNMDFIVGGKVRIKLERDAEFSDLLREPLKTIHLEVPLLMYLLIDYSHSREVFATIENFLREIRPILSPLDFEKTRTGVTRCFTNTRFAAVVLRDFGFLRFGHKEAFKKWQLSFLGLLVAGILYEPGWRKQKKWKIDYFRNVPKQIPMALSQVVELLEDHSMFLDTLQRLCSKGGIKFDVFEKSRNEIYSLLTKYSHVLVGEKLNINDKKKKLVGILGQIERIDSVEKFLKKFALGYEMKDFNSRIREFLSWEWPDLFNQ